MRKRAALVGETRSRIVEATVRLHGSLGPAATTISAVAAEAGVTRLTVYRHFPDEDSLFSACSAHWLAQQQVPDPEAWQRIRDPLGRFTAGLGDIYRFYRDGEPMLTRILGEVDALPDRQRHGLQERDRGFRDALLAGFPVTVRRRRQLRAVVGHAVSFWTWRSLCVDQQLSDKAAVSVMSDLVETTVHRLTRVKG